MLEKIKFVIENLMLFVGVCIPIILSFIAIFKPEWLRNDIDRNEYYKRKGL